ncbi:glucose-1-phosphate cytidylyltransferase [Candidatus Woesebacteria bacterium RIFCSPLOWO2_01_FULL_39_61]|uniref:Glucose-1-phosphate cytidylyltransferase n=1 Tax=Candidatus Woesebacteria bacterium RIFCSPHIGHO2_02_FULL_39_13 TaxID=1802505 RepID=A0A1F7Z307_9BACT|nr:MAG: glucose-1-phosphate cytidylyltransferase [Candidatus Woesebacteria bacterium RIFCSPHIGHO2_01_FULL_39_95]OGM33820.1 MAG: glucose-1-phosphate cytidylyltransferase [Candidatus Woesebacteria bacterium RIFCSPHIGHO2_02_FULL_39_13]OGM38981.1 MAG: glucose-1-phosphate cytidylyltransferase [Candidatus Woesebacteria bacterium RIFCSPHIGHO2_12_FULL_40_20]OGM67486.1 MAG: glucose-1-phosphate cytidylyltransferase [Candidatus Woesebacteria bacterium RIFCSPLOWO2_01_FULL_39_61]OGM72817.1 MAG: glucose-1-ph
MKVVILAGGYGTRISEETGVRPKPMVEIGGKPILWHIMKIYSHYGVNDFIICLGYKGEVIKDYFANYHLDNADVTFNLAEHSLEVHKNGAENWKVTLVDTGSDTLTGGRIKRIKNYVGGETFCLTYGDGVGDINIKRLVDFHSKQKVLATLTAVQVPSRFGGFTLKGTQTKITDFREKPKIDSTWINGGFFVLDPGIFDYIEGDQTVWEQEPMIALSRDGQLTAFRHEGYWQNMDTLRDKNLLEEIWKSGQAPWKVWEK